MFPFFKHLPRYEFPLIKLTPQHTKDAVMKEIAFLEARIEAINRIQKEKKLQQCLTS